MFAARSPIAGSTPIHAPMSKVQRSTKTGEGGSHRSRAGVRHSEVRGAAQTPSSHTIDTSHLLTFSTINLCTNTKTPINTGRELDAALRERDPKHQRARHAPVSGSRYRRNVTSPASMPASRPFSKRRLDQPRHHREGEDRGARKSSHGPNLSAEGGKRSCR